MRSDIRKNRKLELLRIDCTYAPHVYYAGDHKKPMHFQPQHQIEPGLEVFDVYQKDLAFSCKDYTTKEIVDAD